MKATTSPRPWRHHRDGKLMSAVLDADGKLVCGSLICQQSSQDRVLDHDLIVEAVNFLWEKKGKK